MRVLRSFLTISAASNTIHKQETVSYAGEQFPASWRKTQRLNAWNLILHCLILQIHAFRRCVLCWNAITCNPCGCTLMLRKYYISNMYFKSTAHKIKFCLFSQYIYIHIYIDFYRNVFLYVHSKRITREQE